jgi:ribosomal protein S18 acetylase RimI-like enzyme
MQRMKYKIRKATFEDAKGIATLHVKGWRETYKGIVVDEHLKNLSIPQRTKKWQLALAEPKKDEWIFVVEDSKGTIVGLISGGRSRDTKIKKFKGELYAIYIYKNHQKNKLGYRLTKKLCLMLKKHRIQSMFVIVLRDNDSKNFYAKYGAKQFKTKKVEIGKRTLVEDYYGWRNFNKFV